MRPCWNSREPRHIASAPRQYGAAGRHRNSDRRLINNPRLGVGLYAVSMATQQIQSLQDKLCLVTGGSRGIGLEIARMLLKEGARVEICGRSAKHLDMALAELSKQAPGKVSGKVADVKNHEEV